MSAREKVTLATNLAVIGIAAVVVVQPNGVVRRSLRAWNVARQDARAVQQYWGDLTANAHVMGVSDSLPPKAVVFTDYQCPYCSRMHGVEQGIEPATLRQSVRHLPLRKLHSNAELAARISICSESDPQTWPEVHAKLFELADSLSEVDWVLAFRDIRRPTDVDLATCVGAAGTAERLAVDEEFARKLGISVTPSYVFPDHIVRGLLDEDDLRKRVR